MKAGFKKIKNSMDKYNDLNNSNKKQIDLDLSAFLDRDNAVLKKYGYLQITDSTNIPPPIEIIRISGELISTEGNITTISGASKSGKSAFTGVLIAGAIAESEYDNLPDVTVTPANGKAVLHFDSEQARHKHQKNLKSIFKRAGLNSCPKNLLSYNIREEDVENYCMITEEIVYAAFEQFNGIHLIIIDGGADYIRDVNEPNQSNALVKFFEDLAIKFKTAVIVIVHVNPNSDKERGHFGSQLQRKSESVLSIKTEGDISFLEPKLLRSAGRGNIPLIQFMFDKEKGYHVYCGIKPQEEQGVKDLKRIEKIKETAKTIFAPPIALTYKDSLDKIMKHTSKQIATAKDMFKEMKAHETIVQGEDKYWRLNMNIGQV
ncbi:MAG: AAA family ATPase [Patescibacteria group bacterium]